MKKLISLFLVMSITLASMPVRADGDDNASQSSGSGAGAILGVALVALLVWAFSGKNSADKTVESPKSDVVPKLPTEKTTNDIPEARPGGVGGGVGVNNTPEY